MISKCLFFWPIPQKPDQKYYSYFEKNIQKAANFLKPHIWEDVKWHHLRDFLALCWPEH